MTLPARVLLTLAAISMLTFTACDKGDKGDAKDGDKKSDKADDKPSLMLTNDTPVCRAALKCCEAMVEADKGKATPEDINLSCSGVGMADNDELCTQFRDGYVASIEASGKPVPDTCK